MPAFHGPIISFAATVAAAAAVTSLASSHALTIAVAEPNSRHSAAIRSIAPSPEVPRCDRSEAGGDASFAPGVRLRQRRHIEKDAIEGCRKANLLLETLCQPSLTSDSEATMP